MSEAEKRVSVSFVRHYKTSERSCPVCGTVFQAPRLRIYCSSDCKLKASWERNGAVFNERRRARWAGKKDVEQENEP